MLSEPGANGNLIHNPISVVSLAGFKQSMWTEGEQRYVNTACSQLRHTPSCTGDSGVNQQIQTPLLQSKQRFVIVCVVFHCENLLTAVAHPFKRLTHAATGTDPVSRYNQLVAVVVLTEPTQTLGQPCRQY